MSQERKRVDDVHESDSDQEIDFDAAWKERFGEDSSKGNRNNTDVNEDGYDGNIDFENQEPDGSRQRIEVKAAPESQDVKIRMSKMLPPFKSSSSFSFGTNVNNAGDIEELHTSSSFSLQCCSFENPKRYGILMTISIVIVVTIIVIKFTVWDAK